MWRVCEREARSVHTSCSNPSARAGWGWSIASACLIAIAIITGVVISIDQAVKARRAESVAFHPELPTLATTGGDAVVRFWTTRDLIASDEARLVGEFPLEVGFATASQFSNDGHSLHILHSARGISTLRASH